MDLGDWVPLSEPQLLWANTIVLILASVVFQWTRNVATGDAPGTTRLKLGMVLTGVLTLMFLLGQLVAWRELNASGLYMTSGPATSFFFMITGLHALHILGGMFVWARATQRLFVGNDDVGQSIELCTIYWHFLLLVWFVLFGLMLQT
jgi:cytochrome c oxidase subunit 3